MSPKDKLANCSTSSLDEKLESCSQSEPQNELAEFIYASNQIVCGKDDKGGSEVTLVLASQQENAKVGIKK